MLGVVLGVLLVASVANASGPEHAPVITVLSNRADLVSGGQALVQVTLPPGTDPADVRVALNGQSVTTSFAVRPNGNFEGMVTGLVRQQELLDCV